MFFKKSKAEVIPNLDGPVSALEHKTRVVVFIYDKDDYKEEYKQLIASARYLTSRFNLRIGVVSNKSIIKKMKKEMGGNWFSSVAMSSVVLKRYDGRWVNFDLTSGDPINFTWWINKNSLKPVEELKSSTSFIQDQLR